jgi:hypothetical protein
MKSSLCYATSGSCSAFYAQTLYKRSFGLPGSLKLDFGVLAECYCTSPGLSDMVKSNCKLQVVRV